MRDLGIINHYIKIAQKLHPEILIQNFSAIDTIKGWLLPIQFPILYSAGLSLSGGKIVEIGSYQGKSACTWGISTDKNFTEIHCVDPFIWGEEHYLDKFKENINKFGLKDRINIHQGKSMEKVLDFEDNSIDLLYIDAGHDYNEVKEDIIFWKSKLKKDAIVLGHDMPDPDDQNGGFEGLAKAVYEEVRDSNDFKHFGFFGGIWGAVKK